MNQQETKEAQGTSLEVLAPYLPYGIEVVTSFYGRCQLDGASTCDCIVKVPDFEEQDCEELEICEYRDVRPVLRPFEALVQPLEDGTVPYLEVQKMLGNKRHSNPAFRGLEVREGSILEHWLSSSGDVYSKLGIMRSHIWGENLQANVADYLRRHHFAVGLQPHQYISK